MLAEEALDAPEPAPLPDGDSAEDTGTVIVRGSGDPPAPEEPLGEEPPDEPEPVPGSDEAPVEDPGTVTVRG